MFELLSTLLELQGTPPTEQDLTNSKAYKDFVGTWPKLEKQLKLAWNGDSREMARGGHKSQAGENVYMFPKIIMVKNLQKFEPDFALTLQAKHALADLYKLFCDKFRIANTKNRNWLESLDGPAA